MSQIKMKKSFFAFFVLIMALIAIGAGTYIQFFAGRGYIKTEAKIVEIRETVDASGEKDSTAIVQYTVNGKTYTEELGYYSPNFKEGQVITVKYDPADPTKVRDTSMFGLVILLVGIGILAVWLFTYFRTRQLQKTLQEDYPLVTYPKPQHGPKRHLYFLTDLGTPKYGHHIEDATGKVLFEAKMTRFSLTTPYGFDFIDHEHGVTKPHLIGHEEASEIDTLLIDNHYTFSFDGEDIWKHLRRNGIRVDSRLAEGKLLRTCYTIYHEDEEIGYVETSSVNVHEEDAAEKGDLIPRQGFYRIDTDATDLELLFVTILAFARSGALDDRGGTYGMIGNTLFGKKDK